MAREIIYNNNNFEISCQISLQIKLFAINLYEFGSQENDKKSKQLWGGKIVKLLTKSNSKNSKNITQWMLCQFTQLFEEYLE